MPASLTGWPAFFSRWAQRRAALSAFPVWDAQSMVTGGSWTVAIAAVVSAPVVVAPVVAVPACTPASGAGAGRDARENMPASSPSTQ
ncbi:hypothetical protein D1872_233160 [compost metagenome]